MLGGGSIEREWIFKGSGLNSETAEALNRGCPGVLPGPQETLKFDRLLGAIMLFDDGACNKLWPFFALG